MKAPRWMLDAHEERGDDGLRLTFRVRRVWAWWTAARMVAAAAWRSLRGRP